VSCALHFFPVSKEKGVKLNISYLQLATRRIAEVSTSSKIVVEKSTVPCRTAE
jgi:UDPglucose 6-dehydrogenase